MRSRFAVWITAAAPALAGAGAERVDRRVWLKVEEIGP